MGIYIKDMQMPTSCWNCDIGRSEYSDGIRCPFYDLEYEEQCAYKETRHEGCPIMNVPPHGRLIDADALMKDGWVLQKYEEKPTHLVTHTMPLNCPSVPTIIEAEEGEE